MIAIRRKVKILYGTATQTLCGFFDRFFLHMMKKRGARRYINSFEGKCEFVVIEIILFCSEMYSSATAIIDRVIGDVEEISEMRRDAVGSSGEKI